MKRQEILIVGLVLLAVAVIWVVVSRASDAGEAKSFPADGYRAGANSLCLTGSTADSGSAVAGVTALTDSNGETYGILVTCKDGTVASMQPGAHVP